MKHLPFTVAGLLLIFGCSDQTGTTDTRTGPVNVGVSRSDLTFTHTSQTDFTPASGSTNVDNTTLPGSLILATKNTSTFSPTWWDATYHYRVPITLTNVPFNGSNQARTNFPIEILLNASTVLPLPAGQTINSSSIQVVDDTGTLINSFYDPATNAGNAYLVFPANLDATGAGASKTYYIYYDTTATANGTKSPPSYYCLSGCPSTQIDNGIVHWTNLGQGLLTTSSPLTYQNDGQGFAGGFFQTLGLDTVFVRHTKVDYSVGATRYDYATQSTSPVGYSGYNIVDTTANTKGAYTVTSVAQSVVDTPTLKVNQMIATAGTALRIRQYTVLTTSNATRMAVTLENLGSGDITGLIYIDGGDYDVSASGANDTVLWDSAAKILYAHDLSAQPNSHQDAHIGTSAVQTISAYQADNRVNVFTRMGLNALNNTSPFTGDVGMGTQFNIGTLNGTSSGLSTYNVVQETYSISGDGYTPDGGIKTPIMDYSNPPTQSLGTGQGVYETSGTFYSSVIDSNSASPTWTSLAWVATLPTGGTIAIAARVGTDTSPPVAPATNPNWTAWTSDATTSPLSLAGFGSGNRYIQYRVTFTNASSPGGATPVLDSVTISATETPTRLAFTNASLAVATNTCSAVQTIQSQDSQGQLQAVSNATTVNLSTSTSSTGKFYSNSGCSTLITTVTIGAGASTSGNFYYKDTAAGGPTLTAAASGLTSGTLVANVFGAASALVVSGIPSPTFVGAWNSVTVRAVDSIGQTVVTYNKKVTLTSNDGTATLPAQYTFVAATDKGVHTFSSAAGMKFGSAGTFSVTATDNSGTPLTGSQTGIVSQSQVATTAALTKNRGTTNRTNGAVPFTVTNGNLGEIMWVSVAASPSNFTWSTTTTDQTTSLTGWTVQATGTLVKWCKCASDCGGSGCTGSSFANSTSATFSAQNLTIGQKVYPASAAYTTTITWNQNGASATATPTFTVANQISDLALPAVSRSAQLSGARFYWTFTDVNQVHAGALLQQCSAPPIGCGNDRPVDGVSYSTGGTIGSSKVMYVSDSVTTSWVEPSPSSYDDQAHRYVLYNFDAFNGYSPGYVIDAPAKPTWSSGFVYRHGSFGLTPPGIWPGASGYVIFAANNSGLYPGIFFINYDGTEHRRAVTVNASITRWSPAIPLGIPTPAPNPITQAPYVFSADSSATLYKVDPATSASPTTAASGGAVTTGMSVLYNAFSTLNSTYGTEAFLYGTNNGGSGNIIRALDGSLNTKWTFNMSGSDAASSEIAGDLARGVFVVPVGAGNGGVMAFDMRSATTPAPKPAGWSAQTILSGNLFKAQCRVPYSGSSVLLCGSYTGTLYAVNPTTGVTITTFTAGGGIKSIFPKSSNSSQIVYTTYNGLVGRVDYNGSTFTQVWEVSPDTCGAVSAAQASNDLSGQPAVYLGACGKLHKLRFDTGAEASGAPIILDGNAQVSEIGMDYSSGLLYAETAAGTIWGVPLF